MKALVLDDEPPARRELGRQLKKVGAHEVFEAGSVKAALETLSQTSIDVLLLDVEMRGGGGFELLASPQACEIPAIFVTAHAEHAARAFEFRAVDYLLKPVTEDRLRQALSRVESGGGPRRFVAEDRILLRDGSKTHFIKVGDIKALEASGAYTRVLHAAGAATVSGTLTLILERLDPDSFLRVSRTHAVNLRQVTSVNESSNGQLVLQVGDKLNVEASRRQSAEFRRRFAV